MALELVGKLHKLLPEVTGQGRNGAWKKQEFVIETADSQFPKMVCLSIWGDKTDDLKQFALGDTLKVTFNVESREYNERWYTEARAWRVELDNGSAAPAAAGAPRQSSGASAPQARAASSPMPFSSTSFDEETNDLPF
ncbi:DUF3127 domain-containing protein [Rudanella paleaurantiibacter]|uniref:DUF3127 domain-containing protein n=1 Tax=Rudanella paleaurantiibacter TaxID=2614655 RepID=A0A7J5TWW0_9BACT|nr:DUF3127 domain-containing protein [Rudanella paleaurantiibacter]KAB7727916.1 DUF3127 domain-containing protein [Rudanella paleaurantiibacter]